MITTIQATIPVEVVVEKHNTITASLLHTTRNVACNLDILNTIDFKILPSVLLIFPYRIQLIQMLQSGDEQQPFGLVNYLLIEYDEDIR